MTASIGIRRSGHALLASTTWWAIYLATVGGGLIVGVFAGFRLWAPYLGLSLGILALLLAGWLIYPRQSLYAVLCLTAISDIVTVSWFPFVKNFSSSESIAYVADALTISPLDLTLAVGVIVSVARQYARHRRLLARSEMAPSVLVFMGFVALGFANGLVRGASVRIAVLESISMWHILLVFVVVTNELTNRDHLRRALWALTVGVMVQSLLSLEYLARLDPGTRADLVELNEHGSALGQNLVVVALVLSVLLGSRMVGRSLLLFVAAVPTAVVMVVSQRRAGFAALAVALVLVAAMVYWHRRATFWTVVPICAVVGGAYVAAFWNSTSGAGFAAQAVKSILAPGSVSEEDQSSDLYRWAENINLNFTIHTSPLRGLGFGHAFYRAIELAEINDWELAAYTPHNSILWVWIKLGFVGFAAMFYMFGRALLLCSQKSRSLMPGADLVTLMLAGSFVAMYAVFTWFDISWDARNTVFLGFALAVIGRPLALPEEPPLGVEHPGRSGGGRNRPTPHGATATSSTERHGP